MKLLLSAATALGLLMCVAAQAQPASVTATCKDGTSFTGTSRSGACRGHGGVQAWGTGAATGAATSTATSNAPPASTKSAPGGGPGQVWVNTSTKVYHCAGDRWYGKTKQGEYMSESKAKAAGYHPDHNKACTS